MCLRRRRRHRVANSGRRVAPPWLRRIACLQRLAGTDPVSLRSWSVQRARGRPGRSLQSLPSERPDSPTWHRALWPNTDKRRLLNVSTIDGELKNPQDEYRKEFSPSNSENWAGLSTTKLNLSVHFEVQFLYIQSNVLHEKISVYF